MASVEIRATPVKLLRPREGSTNFVMDEDIREITSNLIEVREVGVLSRALHCVGSCTLANLSTALKSVFK